MSNDFSIEVRALNVHHNFCRLCHCNQSCSLHHIFGRSVKHANSAVNSIWLCGQCHAKADAHNRGTGIKGTASRQKMLKEQIRFLMALGYEYVDNDHMFLLENEIDLKKVMAAKGPLLWNKI
jgi:hypothetical protein